MNTSDPTPRLKSLGFTDAQIATLFGGPDRVWNADDYDWYNTATKEQLEKELWEQHGADLYTVTIKDIDLRMLDQQRLALAKLLNYDENHLLYGVVNLLDHISDMIHYGEEYLTSGWED